MGSLWENKLWLRNHQTLEVHTMWGPPVVSWFISPSNYSYKYHKPVIGVMFTNLDILGASHCKFIMIFNNDNEYPFGCGPNPM